MSYLTMLKQDPIYIRPEYSTHMHVNNKSLLLIIITSEAEQLTNLLSSEVSKAVPFTASIASSYDTTIR